MRGNCCRATEARFNEKLAANQLEGYRKGGPNRTTSMLLAALRAQDLEWSTLLDVGGGIGVLHHELLAGNQARATNVDISSAYLAAAKAESRRRRHEDRVRFVHADFVDAVDLTDPADVVTLDRVICCYEGLEQLVDASAAKAVKLYGAVYPRDKWWVRIGNALSNLGLRIRGQEHRTYVHDPRRIEALLLQHGLRRRSIENTFVWHVAVFAK
ncbi:MAG: class I SAM-dependent methyltransferase [Gemmatimonadetes bacterium]|nr:class I SAM-dependent methyltransferase [Gemmatimonadota bacterium]